MDQRGVCPATQAHFDLIYHYELETQLGIYEEMLPKGNIINIYCIVIFNFQVRLA